ncbi:hypothetical protein KX729_32310, partial [Rhizobium sp. XQZ8]|uniref:hypothetical protein n=1 Tax=Rhizobium populisoli TaxID=2859785 RepID=UPI001CA4D510
IRGYRRSLLLRLANTAGPTVEDNVDRKAQLGTRVLINDGWYKGASPTGLFAGSDVALRMVRGMVWPSAHTAH